MGTRRRNGFMFRGLTLLAVCLLLSGCAAMLPMSSSFGSILEGRAPTDLHEQTTVSQVFTSVSLWPPQCLSAAARWPLSINATLVPCRA
jgi:hypothetical protein